MMQFDVDIQSEYKELFLKVRKYLLAIEGVEERKTPRITSYYLGGSGLCHVRTTADGVDIGFLKGAQFRDEFGCLKGNSKKMRVLAITGFDKTIFNYYLQQAILINQ